MPSWNCASAELVSDGRATGTGKRHEIDGAARIAGFGRALEQRARLRLVLGDALPGRERDAKLDHRRGAAFVGRLAIGRNRFGYLLARRIGAAELIERAARCRRLDAAVLDRGRNVRGRDLVNVADVGRLVRVARICGNAVAEHEIGRLCARWCMRAGDERQQAAATARDR